MQYLVIMVTASAHRCLSLNKTEEEVGTWTRLLYQMVPVYGPVFSSSGSELRHVIISFHRGLF